MGVDVFLITITSVLVCNMRMVDKAKFFLLLILLVGGNLHGSLEGVFYKHLEFLANVCLV
jgi:hypothetical protein